MSPSLHLALSALALAAGPAAGDSLDGLARDTVQLLARFDPEPWTEAGVGGFEDRIIDLRPDRSRRFREAAAPLLARLAAALESAPPRDATDLQLLASAVRNAIRRGELEARFVPYRDISAVVCGGVTSLLERGTAEARRAAIARLRAYAGSRGAPGAFARSAAALRAALADPELLVPSRGRLEAELALAPQRLEALRERLRAARVTEAAAAMDSLAEQLTRYASLLSEIRTRAPAVQPAESELYEQALRELGIEATPEQLAAAARAAFEVLQARLREEAAAYASARGRAGEPFTATLASVRRIPIPAGGEAKAYREALGRLREIVRTDVGAAIPPLRLEVQVAPGAEFGARPSPHLALAEREHALLAVPGGAASVPPEFRCAAAAWVFGAREGIPGRALRNARMSSPTRSLFGSAAASEGWMSYAEWVVRPWLSPEARLLSLQLELLRAARVFTAPALLRGASRGMLARFLVEQVGVSPELAALEIESAARAPAEAALAHAGLLGWLGLDRVASENGLTRGEFLARALALGPVPPGIASAALLTGAPNSL